MPYKSAAHNAGGLLSKLSSLRLRDKSFTQEYVDSILDGFAKLDIHEKSVFAKEMKKYINESYSVDEMIKQSRENMRRVIESRNGNYLHISSGKYNSKNVSNKEFKTAKSICITVSYYPGENVKKYRITRREDGSAMRKDKEVGENYGISSFSDPIYCPLSKTEMDKVLDEAYKLGVMDWNYRVEDTRFEKESAWRLEFVLSDGRRIIKSGVNYEPNNYAGIVELIFGTFMKDTNKEIERTKRYLKKNLGIELPNISGDGSGLF